MELREYWRLFSKRWWLVLLVALAATSAAYGWSKLQRPLYRSTVKLLVTPARPDAGQTIAAQNLVRQYGVLATSERLAQTVSQRLQLDLPPAALVGKVRTAALVDDLSVTVQVDDVDPKRARNIAAALADEFEREQAAKMANVDPRDRIEIAVANPPSEATQSWPQTRTNVLAGALLGLVVGAGLAFALEYVDDTLKTPEDVEYYTRLAVLGAIPIATPVSGRHA